MPPQAPTQPRPPTTPSPQGAIVYIINLKDADTVTSPFKVQFGLTGMGIAPAGVENPNIGHHDLLIETNLADEQLGADWHFGGGQTEAMITPPPGEHTLQLVRADWRHVAHEPRVMSTPIIITVKQRFAGGDHTSTDPPSTSSTLPGAVPQV